jgi:hypothetical protein
VSLGPAGQAVLAAGLRAGPARALETVCRLLLSDAERQFFASMKWLAEDIGVSARTAFRYSKKLKDAGFWRRDPGNRHVFPKGASRRGLLKAHGYAITNPAPFLLDLARQASQSYRRRAAEKKAAKLERQREKRRERDEDRAAWRAAHPHPHQQPAQRPAHAPFKPAPPPVRVEAPPPEVFDAIGARPKRPAPG